MKDLRNKNRQKLKKIKNKGKEKVVDVEDESEMNERVQKQSFNRVLKGRAIVRPLFEAMRGLTPQRKRVVREMGFGNLIDFPIVEIPTKLAFYVVDILNTRKMMLECPMGDIVITPKTVKEVLGLPMGRRKLEREGQREYNDPFLEEWKDQFKNINMLRNVFEGDDVSDIDWCSYIIECASVSKVDWSKTKKKKDVVYYRPVMFLMVIFKEPNIPEFHSSSSTESDDDDDDNSQVGRLIIESVMGTQTESLKKINEEAIIRKGREFSAEIRKNAQQKEREWKRKGKREKDQIGSSSQESPVFGIDNSLQGSQPAFDLGVRPTYEKMKNLIKKKKKMRLKSKYVNKTVDPTVELTEDEKLLRRSIYRIQEEEEVISMLMVISCDNLHREEVFNDNEGLILFRMNIQSLAPGLEIDTSVIDVYVSILNYEEKFKMTNMKRHFFYTSMMVPGILEDKTKEIDKKIDAQYDRFHEMLSIQMEDDIEKMQMEDVELAFFPIIAHGHYYLIVFNLKTGKAVIIDNSESDATYDGKYKDNVEFVLYEGSTAAQWKTGLLLENDKNHRMQMDNLRSRIAAKILLHEVNVY
ncbi:peptidase C48, SUMO/sentrin/Ubl1 [Tanacetum coccineum]